MVCSICPRECGNRINGFCGVGKDIIVSRIAPHDWEEPVISGKNGSGAVFFAGCSMRCVFCQNIEISQGLKGEKISFDELCRRCAKLAASGVHNINFVTPSHYVPVVRSVIESCSFTLPVIYNSGGWDKVQSLKTLAGMVDIYLPDFKYADDSLAQIYSGVNGYFQTAVSAVDEMYRQVGDVAFDNYGMMTKGLLVRHLVLPNHLENTYRVLDWFSDFSRGRKILFSLMSQYTPHGCLKAFPKLQRELTADEYYKVSSYMGLLGIKGFVQEEGSADEKYIPSFLR